MNILDLDDVEAIALAILKSSAAASIDLRKYSKGQKTSYAENIDSVATLLKNGLIGENTARASIDAFTGSQEQILLAIKAMTKAEAQIAINAGLSAVAKVVNKAVGVALLPV